MQKYIYLKRMLSITFRYLLPFNGFASLLWGISLEVDGNAILPPSSSSLFELELSPLSPADLSKGTATITKKAQPIS
jgi:hypothetical protein